MTRNSARRSDGGRTRAAARARAVTTAVAALALLAAEAGAGGAAAMAAGHTGEPPEIAERTVSAMAAPAIATWEMSIPVTGMLTDPAGGARGGDELHFQERVSGNVYTVRTQANGAFTTRLPQGVYDLRGIYGDVIAGGVAVGAGPVNLGQMHPPGRYDVRRLFQRQEVGEAIVTSPAPAAAYVPAPGETGAPIAVIPVRSARVMGAGPSGKALAPAEVMPAGIQEQTALPPDAQVPAPGAPPPTDLAP